MKINSRNIKVKGFYHDHPEQLATLINNWLEQNDVELIDIKFAQSTGDVSNLFSALVIYKY